MNRMLHIYRTDIRADTESKCPIWPLSSFQPCADIPPCCLQMLSINSPQSASLNRWLIVCSEHWGRTIFFFGVFILFGGFFTWCKTIIITKPGASASARSNFAVSTTGSYTEGMERLLSVKRKFSKLLFPLSMPSNPAHGAVAVRVLKKSTAHSDTLLRYQKPFQKTPRGLTLDVSNQKLKKHFKQTKGPSQYIISEKALWIPPRSHLGWSVIKCKKERGTTETCPQCSSPQPLNGTILLGLTQDKLSCERPVLRSPLKQWNNPVWAESEAEPDLPYTRDFEKPLGHLTFVLSDSHGNHAHVACGVRHPGDSSPMTWTVNPHSPGELSVNVSLATVLECEIDRETLQNLWQLVAYYYESPAILERGQQRGNASRLTYQYVQAVNENSPYFTELKGYLVAEPAWLLQPRVTLRLNRKQTTTKKLVMDFTTLITRHFNSDRGQHGGNDFTSSWALIRKGTAGQVQTALEGSKVALVCSVITSDVEVKVEWILPDLSVVEEATDKIEISETGELVIFNATLSDSGLYHCMVRTKAGVDLVPLRLTIKERSLGPAAFNGQKVVVEKGKSFSLPCDVTSVQPSQTIWYLPKNQVLLPTQQTRRAEVMANGTLVLRKLTQEDAGEYSCLASNLYGVDMLSHIVEVTGEKASDRPKLETKEEQQILPTGTEEVEGSGRDYQEIIRPFATQFPKKVGTPQRNPNGFPKRIRIKDSKRKPNKSVKEVDPNRWAQMLAKANTRPGVALPTEASVEKLSTGTIQTSTSKPTSETTTTIVTTANNLPNTKVSPDISIEPNHLPKTYLTESNDYHGKDSKTLETLPRLLQPPHPRSTAPSSFFTDSSVAGTPQPGGRKNQTQLTEEDEYYEEYNYKDTDSVDISYNLGSETIHTTHELDSSLFTLPSVTEKAPNIIISKSGHNITIEKTVVATELERMGHPTERPDGEKTQGEEKFKERVEIRIEAEKDRNNNPFTEEHERKSTTSIEKHNLFTEASEIDTEKSKKHWVTQHHNTQEGIQLTTQNRPRPNTQTPAKQNIPTQARIPSFKVITSPSAKGRTREEGIQDQDKEIDKTKAQIDRITQLGRMATPKPHSSYYNPLLPITPKPNPPPSHRPANSKPLAPTYSLQSPNTAKPSSSPFYGFIPTPSLDHATTPADLNEKQWPFGAGQIRSPQPTAPRPFPWLLGAGGSGAKPHITTVTAASVSVLAESDVFLPCQATGNPEPSIAWTKVSTRATVPANTKHGPRFEVLGNGTFIIKNIQLQDRGQYLCTAQNRFGTDRMVITLAVQTEAPKIQPPKYTEIAIYLGKSVSLDCLASGKPPAQISWILPDRTFVRDVGTVHSVPSPMSLLENGTLQLHFANFSSKGDYKCIASNAAGADTITYHLHVAALPPNIIEGATDTVIIPPGRSVYVHCSVKGEPVPALKWMLPAGFHIKPSQFVGRRLFVFPNGTLFVKNVSPSDAMYGSAVYLHCPESTESTRGTIWQLPSKTIMEHRYSPGSPIKVFRNGTLRILQLTELDGGNYVCVFQRPNGEDMELFQVDCVATGLPDPEVSWGLPDGTLINNALQSDDSGLRNRRYVIFDNGTLLLQQMGKKDEGDYTCYAKNKLGKDEKKLSVKVGPNAPHIRSKSQSYVAKLGQSAKMTCQATGEPTPRIMWISPRNDVISMSSDKFQIVEDGTLVVKKVTLTDEGKYTCVARNSAGDDIKYMRLDVEPQEPFINGIKGKNTMKVLGVSYQTALLDCRVEGKPEPKVWWVTPYGHSLATPYLGGRFQVHRNGSLELRGVRKTDEGRYMCLAKNSRGEASIIVELEVASLAEKPSFAVPNIEILPIKQDGRELILDCSARGKPNPEFAWLLPNGTMLMPGVRLQRFTHYPGNGTLRISQPVPTDKGVYRCLAKNVAGQAEKRYALEEGRKPVIRGSTAGMKITYGLNLNLPCTVDGWPQASITWMLPNGLVLDKPQTIGRISFLANGTLQLRQVATFDKGTYICKASNSFGSSTLSYPVSVMVFPPRITNTLPSITRVNRGSKVTLNCVAAGIPKPDISWTLPGRTTLIPHNRYAVQGGIHMTEEGSLVIQNPMLMNSGIYKCNAKNALGTDFKSTYLQVV
ncbi:Matrix-remodeling-associated protein 5 [Channa argus]|uniref:Matrix-remodeling-associated protein 5 n=1 Tax=Channa argus TaxID=215402 RepID=A0A6G1PTI0_CHAAH|nr:Matrix-remodeling-associated protein 5 [Channa argus]